MNEPAKERRELPEGWEWASLESISEPITQIDPRKEHPNQQIKYVDISSVDNSTNQIIGHKEYYGRDAPSRMRKQLRTNDIIFSTVRTYLKNIAYVPEEYNNEFTSTGFCIIRAKPDIMPQYIFHYLLTDEFINRISEKQRGISYPAITDRIVYEEIIPIPPLPEQHRIVARIESLFQEVKAARQSLEKVQPIIKKFRQSVLASAFRGVLVPQNPGDEPASVLLERIQKERKKALGKKYKEPEAVDAGGLAELPGGWEWITWEGILAPDNGAFRRGPFGSTLKKSLFVESGYKVYEQYCPINDDCSFGRYYISQELYDKLESFQVNAGDFLISCSGSLGKITQVPDNFDKGVINQALLRVRINYSLITKEYFIHLFRSQFFQKALLDQSTGTAIQNVRGVKELKSIQIPVPPLPEQHRIVSKIEQLFALADQAELALENAKKRADRMEQAILGKAFRGELGGRKAEENRKRG